jgi:hypothetical protein
LRGKRIKIVAPDPMHPSDITFTRLDTGEAIQNIEEARVEWKAGYITRITLWLVRVDYSAQQVSHEAVVCDAPEIDITALVYQPDVVSETLIGIHDAAWDRLVIAEIMRLRAENEQLKKAQSHEADLQH